MELRVAETFSCPLPVQSTLMSLPRIAFYDAADGRRLAVRIFDSNAAPRAHVVFLHGISSHGGWYVRSGAYLAASGFQAHFLDRRGSGLNADGSGDVDHWQTWIQDVAMYLEPIHREAPVVLCGISWGGKLAVAMARRHPGLIQGVALICPGLYSPHDPGIVKRSVLAMPVPQRFEQQRLRIPLRKPALYTDSQAWRNYIAYDPLTLRRVTWRFARESCQLTRFARQAPSFIHMPMLLMLAGRDRIVDNRRTTAFFRRTAAIKRILIEYPNAAHTLEFEPDPQEYFEDLAGWIGRTVGCDSSR
jgi:acylglycerol lipase